MKGRLIVFAIAAAIAVVGVLVPSALNAVFDGLDLILGWMGPFWAVTFVSALVGVLFILAFPHVSSQRGIKAVKDRIKYNLLAIRLFQDDLPSVLKSTGGTLFWNFAYIGLNLLPLFVLAVPFMFVWFQLNALYAFAPLEPGDRPLVQVELRQGVDPTEVGIELPQAFRVERRVNLADRAAPRILLQLTDLGEGIGDLSLQHGGEEVTKVLASSERPRRLARLRTSEPVDRFLAAEDPILWFGEPVLPDDSFVRAVLVPYPPQPLGFLGGGEMSVMIWFVVVSLAVGFGLKGVFGVEI